MESKPLVTTAEEVRRWWKFHGQQPMSSWHEREDFIEMLENRHAVPDTLAAVVEAKEEGWREAQRWLVEIFELDAARKMDMMLREKAALDASEKKDDGKI